ncbi:DUF3500 domain-containing protein [Wenzhouxiangella sp. XN201]|uniref:DUF3500 domain-containing protein n=1 Tax=Wenzhouxiangella sp. XN201 TaxID=2710755 RepID=UPI0013C9A7C2|nr:DUF3500 domain-containing protein [Wenzhouxiangella sp. XN201]NEZ04917.1 DUF3500 domain-containing protein [Wenzhouxiangella sp. XN201]
MRSIRRVTFASVVLAGLLLVPALHGAPNGNAGKEMSEAAEGFLASLSADQRAAASFAFADDERLDWHFIPRQRRGLSFQDMDEGQRDLVWDLLDTGLSAQGVRKVDDIIALEVVLRELGGNPAMRNPELYFVSIFGDPSGSDPWGWRFEGHHISLNYTIIDGAPLAWAPAFLGANPAEVQGGSRAGLRALGSEEDLARALVRSLDEDQRRQAVVDDQAPSDIFTGNAREVEPLEPAGIAISDLRPEQVDQLVRLMDEYLERMSDDLAASRRARIEASGLDRITFAWAGSLEVGEPHYYRIQGPSFLVEYDNIQNNANHIHSVWRDFDGDFGRDLLREHYEAHPHHN